jgi:hypothetical protein
MPHCSRRIVVGSTTYEDHLLSSGNSRGSDCPEVGLWQRRLPYSW